MTTRLPLDPSHADKGPSTSPLAMVRVGRISLDSRQLRNPRFPTMGEWGGHDYGNHCKECEHPRSYLDSDEAEDIVRDDSWQGVRHMARRVVHAILTGKVDSSTGNAAVQAVRLIIQSRSAEAEVAERERKYATGLTDAELEQAILDRRRRLIAEAQAELMGKRAQS